AVPRCSECKRRRMPHDGLPTVTRTVGIGNRLLATTTAVEPARQRSQVAFAELNANPKPAASNADADVSKRKHVSKREPAKKVVAHRAAAPLNIAPAPTYIVQEPRTRMSLLETLKERLGQTLFKLN